MNDKSCVACRKLWVTTIEIKCGAGYWKMSKWDRTPEFLKYIKEARECLQYRYRET